MSALNEHKAKEESKIA